MKKWLNKLNHLWESVSNHWLGEVYIIKDDEPQLLENEVQLIQADSSDFLLLQRISRDAVMEPFEGKQSLLIMQKTMSGLDKGVQQIKEKSSNAWKKLGKIKSDSNLALPAIKKSGMMSGILDKAEKLASGVKEAASDSWENIENKAKEFALNSIKETLENLVKKEAESWITQKVPKILDRDDIHSLEDMRRLSYEERAEVTAALYPFDTTFLSGITKTLDKTANYTMGIVVATNFPGTGIAMSMINMAKTWIRLANRIQSLSIIHGYKVESAEKLFNLCAKIIESMNNWETNADHVPLSPNVLTELYEAPTEKNDEWFQQLMTATLKKDAYIAIPGVGMISLGKIELDEMKLDLMVHHLIENYFDNVYLSDKYDLNDLKTKSDLLKSIYRSFLNQDFFSLSREQYSSEEDGGNWKSKMKKVVGDEEMDKKISGQLDLYAHLIALEVFEDNLDSSIEKLVKEKIDVQKNA